MSPNTTKENSELSKDKIIQSQARIIKLQAEYIKKLEEKVKLLERRVKLLEKRCGSLLKILESYRKELRKYKNENTPSGSLPPYLKDELNNLAKIEENRKSKAKSKSNNTNVRNSRLGYSKKEVHRMKLCPYCHNPVIERKTKRKRIVIHLELQKAEPVLHEIHTYYCEHCNKVVEPMIPNTLPKSKYDLNIHLFIITLSILGLSQRKIAEVFRLFDIEMTSSSVNNVIHRVENYLGRSKYNELRKEIEKSISVHMDERGWRHKGKTFWIWVATTAKSVFYTIDKSRGASTAKKLPAGKILVSDGHKAYDKLNKPIQRCWAHLLRKLRNPDYFREEWEVDQYKESAEGLLEIFIDAKNTKERSKEIRRMFEKRLREFLLKPRKEERNLRAIINYISNFFKMTWYISVYFFRRNI
jgi:transposase-like protein